MPENSVHIPHRRDSAAGFVANVAPLIVHDRKELAAALRQHEKSVIIDRAELAATFHKLLYWRTAHKWFLPASVSAFKASRITHAIRNDNKLEAAWDQQWKVGTFDGRIVLTPRQP